MKTSLQTHSKNGSTPTSSFTPMQIGLLQRKCGCGGSPGLTEECAECAKKKGTLQRSTSNQSASGASFSLSRIPLIQPKLTVGANNDPLEQEADRIADQVLAVPANLPVNVAAPHIQRVTGLSTGQTGTAPHSVEHVLASPSRPLDSAIRQDMEQRFGHDFSRVRVHTGGAAEQSVRDVSANAYTVGHNIVFGAGRFAPGTHEGRRLIAHELTHVVQQLGSDGIRGGQNNEKSSLSPITPLSHVVQQSSGQSQGVRLQRWSWAEIKEKAYDGMITGIHKARDGMRNGLKRLAADHLPASLFPIADGIIEVAMTVVDLIVTIIMAVLGIVVGFGEGIIGMIEGLFALAYGVIKILYDLIAGIFTSFDAVKQDLNAVLEALKNLPSALKKLVTGWIDKFEKAPSERQSLMIGELTGQVLALIATFAVAAGRAGTAAKVAATGDAVVATGDAASVVGAAGDVVTTTARAKPVLTVIEGGGGRASSTAARAAAGPGAADMSGSTALKWAPKVAPVPSPVSLVAPLPVEAAPVVAPAVTLASSATKAVVAGVGVAAAKVTKVAPKPKPKDPSCDSPTGLTRADPIPMVWYKVREDDYYPKRLSIQNQVYGRDDPSNPRKLPLGEPLGVPNKYWPRLNKVMQLIPRDRGPNADRFRAVLTKYGFDWNGLQADHVQDLDWGGPDEFENLWPLSDSANLSAGPRQNNHQTITYCETPDGPHVVNQTLTAFKASPGHFGRFFRIDRVER